MLDLTASVLPPSPFIAFFRLLHQRDIRADRQHYVAAPGPGRHHLTRGTATNFGVGAESGESTSDMKVVLLAGGLGTRIAEETSVRPKPMVEIGHRPILWHIMQHYSHFGHREFIVCLGYKGEHIKRYFADSLALGADVTIDFATSSVEVLDTPRDDWRVTLVDTGQWTQTGGRLSRVQSLLGDEPFLMTYGDGVSDVDLDELVAFHRRRGVWRRSRPFARPPASAS